MYLKKIISSQQGESIRSQDENKEIIAKSSGETSNAEKTYSEATINAAKESLKKKEEQKVLLAKKEASERSSGEYVKFICEYIDTGKQGRGGDNFGDSKCLAKWKEGFGWHDVKLTRIKNLKKFEWETIEISNGVDGWSVVEGCFVNDSEKRSNWRSRIKICGRKPTAKEREEIGTLWRGV